MAKSKPASPEKPKTIQIVSVKLTRRYVKIAYKQGEDEFNNKWRDIPLPSFYEAMEALCPLVSLICHFPKDYHETGLRVSEFHIGSKGGAQTIVIHAAKDLDDSSKQFEIKTPERLLEKPTEEGSYSEPLTEAKRAFVWEAIEEARKYIIGERAQGQLTLEDDPAGEPDPADSDTAPFPNLTEPAKK